MVARCLRPPRLVTRAEFERVGALTRNGRERARPCVRQVLKYHGRVN
jgi:hypothetical protein